MGKDLTCRVTVGIANPYTGGAVPVGSFVVVNTDDPKFGPLIGTYLIPIDGDEPDAADEVVLEDDAGAGGPSVDEEAAADDAAPAEPDPDAYPADASERPSDATWDAPAPVEGESLAGTG